MKVLEGRGSSQALSLSIVDFGCPTALAKGCAQHSVLLAGGLCLTANAAVQAGVRGDGVVCRQWEHICVVQG